MKKIIITGHNGFIGSHLSKSLSEIYEVIGISDSINSHQNIFEIKKNILDLTSNDVPTDVYCIIHLAALSDVAFCQNNPDKCYNVNLLGTQKLLNISKEQRCKFLYFSTSHIYGSPTKLPISESASFQLGSIYAGSKAAGEILCQSYSNSYHLDISVLRLFSVYGPQSPPHLVISKILNQLKNSNTIKLGNLLPKRDFIFVKDVIDAIKLCLDNFKGFQTYNVGSEESHSIKEICEYLKSISQKNFSIIQDDISVRKNDIPEICSNSNKLKNLGWKPNTSISDGLKITYDSFMNN